MSEESAARWARFAPEDIPTKSAFPLLEAFAGRLEEEGLGGARVLDLGCGAGAVASRLHGLGLEVVGVDINEGAVERARALVPGARFHVRDVAAPEGLDLGEPPFAAVVCQLVISVVGRLTARKSLLANAFRCLEPGGRLYLSASGVSDRVNPAYAQLYEQDFPRTLERATYLSRDESGDVLYETHHFEAAELQDLLEAAGFERIAIEERLESSSRRPREAAVFFYACAQKPAV